MLCLGKGILRERKSLGDNVNTLHSQLLNTRNAACVLLHVQHPSQKHHGPLWERHYINSPELLTLLDSAILLPCTFDKLTANLPPAQTVYFSLPPIFKTQNQHKAGIWSITEEKKLPLRRIKTLIQLLTPILKGEGLKQCIYRPQISAGDFFASVLGLSSISNKLDEGILSWLTLEQI